MIGQSSIWTGRTAQCIDQKHIARTHAEDALGQAAGIAGQKMHVATKTAEAFGQHQRQRLSIAAPEYVKPPRPDHQRGSPGQLVFIDMRNKVRQRRRLFGDQRRQNSAARGRLQAALQTCCGFLGRQELGLQGSAASKTPSG